MTKSYDVPDNRPTQRGAGSSYRAAPRVGPCLTVNSEGSPSPAGR